MYNQNQYRNYYPSPANGYPTQIMPAQVSPVRHIVKKNIIIHPILHVHPAPTPSRFLNPACHRRRFL